MLGVRRVEGPLAVLETICDRLSYSVEMCSLIDVARGHAPCPLLGERRLVGGVLLHLFTAHRAVHGSLQTTNTSNRWRLAFIYDTVGKMRLLFE